MATKKNDPCSTELPPDESVFIRYVLALYSSAMVSLGRIPDPDDGETKVDVPMARETLQYLEVLQRKTLNNLTEEEDRLLGDILTRTRCWVDKACEMLGEQHTG